MADTILNTSRRLNYISGNKIFLLGMIDTESVNELIGNISNMVDDLHWGPVYSANHAPISNPYHVDRRAIKNQIIDVYINSCGGYVNETKSIMMLLNMARAKGAIIRTTNMGKAASSASLIAIQGTPGFRIMYEQAYNMIHYGKSTLSIDRFQEMERAAQYEKEMRDSFNAPYLQCTDLTSDELNELLRTEQGYLNAQECLRKNICDWILTTNGQFIKRR